MYPCFSTTILARFDSRYNVRYLHKDVRSCSRTRGNERSCTAWSSKASEGVYPQKVIFICDKTILLRYRKRHTAHAPHLRVHFQFTSGATSISILEPLPGSLTVRGGGYSSPRSGGGEGTLVAGPGGQAGGSTLVPGLGEVTSPMSTPPPHSGQTN